ncbi:MAG: O-methyltransferase [Actinomycetota bacterium]|nr:O-methyltransferase [Actinomycetota bacterium]
MSADLPDFHQVDAYAAGHSTPLEPLLEELDAATHASLGSPQMLAGPVVGRLLRTLAFSTRPRLIVEIGTYSGYSALAMAPALAQGGRLVTCEVSPEHADFAQSWFDRSGHGERIELRRGPALETLATIEGPIDFVFIDADKDGYVDYYEAVVPKLAPTGLIAADNTLRGGRVITDPESDGARVMQGFNSHVQDDPRTENVLLTVRDGVTVARLA